MRRIGPLLHSAHFRDTKDPCLVRGADGWHIYGTGNGRQLLHATAPRPEGPWTERRPIVLPGPNGSPAAPGIIWDAREACWHAFVQTECFRLGGQVKHWVSRDGERFAYADMPLAACGGREAGIYDPHPAAIGDWKYLVYTAMPAVAHGDLFLARSRSWDGPWDKLGPILTHEQVPFHNQHADPGYEWGLEGAQLVPLPTGEVLLLFVVFLPDGMRGTRQRIAGAFADRPEGPYFTPGLLLPVGHGWEGGENGHATAVVDGSDLLLCYQARATRRPWRYGLAHLPLTALK
jgi:hypothetical protein